MKTSGWLIAFFLFTSCLSMVDKETVGILYESSQTHMVFQKIRLTELIK